MKNIFEESKKKWGRFHAWELHQKTRPDVEKTFKLIGGWVDFFLSKYPPKHYQFPDARGIQKMHKRLSCLSKVE